METLSANYKTVCNKHDIYLKRNKTENTYLINFMVKNENVDLPNIINFKLYDLLFQLNKDILEHVKIIEQPSSNEAHILFLFKQFGKELGIKKKYMFVKTNIEISNNTIIFHSTSMKYEGDLTKGYDMLHDNCSDLRIFINNKHDIHFIYKFNIMMKDKLPIYMENLIGLLMKKIFYRLKIFIENIK